MKTYLLALTRNWLSLIGAALTTASAVLILTFIGLQLFGLRGGPYDGLFAYTLLPVIFVIGLLLIPIGAWLDRRKTRRALARGEAPPAFPVIDLNRDSVRKAALLILALTMLNVVILAVTSFKAVEAMESTRFCGTTCHSVMAPEHTAYERSVHASVPCVDCHVGSGAKSFIEAKLSGTRQLVHLIRGSYPRPVPTPVETLHPASMICGECHVAGRRVGDRLKVITKFADDEKNTETKTVLMMKVDAIHWHADPKHAVAFRSDAKREKVEEVRLGAAEGHEWRAMDCTDCHNRVGHQFRPAAREVDEALADGRLDKSLPFLKREAIRLLTAEYASQQAGKEKIPAGLQAFYAASYAERAGDLAPAIAKAGTTLADIYGASIFPNMKVTWGTYPSHLGHEDSPGCFRCHDEEHKVAADRTVSQDCALCHDVLAQEEENPAILAQLKP